MGWGHMGEWSGWGWYAFGHLLWVAFLIVGIVALLRWTVGRGPHRRPQAPDRALDVLRERYARGEIDQNEFEQRKRVLGS